MYLDTDVVPGKTYYYQVKSMNDWELSAPSSIAKVQVPKATPVPTATPEATLAPQLAPVANIRVSAKEDAVTLAWDDKEGADAYSIYRSEAQLDGYVLVGITKELSFTDRKAEAGKTYFYKVRRVVGMETSADSSTARAEVPTPVKDLIKKFVVVFAASSRVEKADGYPLLNLRVVNTSGFRTVDEVTVTCYCADMFFSPIRRYGYDAFYITQTYPVTIPPGDWTDLESIPMTGFAQARYVYAAVIKFHTTDGQTTEIPEEEWAFSYWVVQ